MSTATLPIPNIPNTPSAAAPAKARLSASTAQLLSIAVESPVLRRIMGLGLPERSNGAVIALNFLPTPRPWLKSHPLRRDELQFDPEIFSTILSKASDGEAYMILWILNVWNPAYARNCGWKFDLFRAVQTLDEGNRNAIADWLSNGAVMP